MEPEILRKGNLYSCDCQHCGATNYWHEWHSEGSSDDLWQQQCEECCKQLGESPDDATQCKGKYYAGRMSMPGYLDCTQWEYETSLARLKKSLREMA
jgi:hypothetical protein